MENIFSYIYDNLVDEAEQIIINNKDDINLYFIIDGKSTTALSYSCEYGKAEMVILLLNNGANVNPVSSCDIFNYSPLLFSCMTKFTQDNLKIVKLLVQHGADINIQGESYQTPLMLAIINKKYEIVEFLIKNGANLELEDFGKSTALIEACRQRDVICVEMLIKAGANINFHNEYNRSALSMAIRKGNLEIVKLLVQHGENVNLQYNNIYFPLKTASARGNLEIVKLLVELGAVVDLQDCFGCTSLHYAVNMGHLEIVKLLVELGANTDIKNNMLETPLDIAKKFKHEKIVTLLGPKNDDKECVVCYENTINFMDISCKHKLCVNCFSEMSKINHKILCPMCRMNISNS